MICAYDSQLVSLLLSKIVYVFIIASLYSTFLTDYIVLFDYPNNIW
jgi:hypothetical protein